MSLDKAIKHGKEKRRPARGPDRTCRAGGSCPYCKGNRLHNTKRRLLAAEGGDNE